MVRGLSPSLIGISIDGLSPKPADSVLYNGEERQESSIRLTEVLKYLRLVTRCASQGSNRTTFSSFVTILHQSKNHLNSRIVNLYPRKFLLSFL